MGERDGEGMKTSTEDGGKITIYVRHETWGQSLANDATTILILCGCVAVNEVTLQSSVLNFLLGVLGVIAMFGWASTVMDGRRIRGATVDEIVDKLRARLK